MKQQERKERLSVRLEPEILATIEHEAAADRRRPSEVVRNIIADWCEARRSEQRHQAA